MKQDEDLQKEILDAIKWEPLLSTSHIEVMVYDGIVTLTGTVDSDQKKKETELVVKNVPGVKTIIERIDVYLNNFVVKTDNQIATEIVNSFRWNWEVPNNRIKVKSENSWVTLDGELEWNHQKEAANNFVSNLKGVTGVTNNITIKS